MYIIIYDCVSQNLDAPPYGAQKAIILQVLTDAVLYYATVVRFVDIFESMIYGESSFIRRQNESITHTVQHNNIIILL
jgi:hypothetical protein